MVSSSSSRERKNCWLLKKKTNILKDHYSHEWMMMMYYRKEKMDPVRSFISICFLWMYELVGKNALLNSIHLCILFWLWQQKKGKILKELSIFRSGFAWHDVYTSMIIWFSFSSIFNIKSMISDYMHIYVHVFELTYFSRDNNQGWNKKNKYSLVTVLLWTIVTIVNTTFY